ncbi:hypothetical protein BsWGS_03436 [Bradybaena similaris]
MSGGSSLVAVAVAVLLLNFAVEEVQSQGSCDVLGVSHAHNDTILMSSSFGCTRLLCENGVLRIVYRGCEVDLECKPENTTYRDLNCREFRCARSSPTSNIYSVVHVKTCRLLVYLFFGFILKLGMKSPDNKFIITRHGENKSNMVPPPANECVLFLTWS